MTWNINYTFPTVGIELEYAFSTSACQSIDQCRRILHQNGFDWIDVKPDGTYEVDVELVLPPIVLNAAMRTELSNLMQICADMGLKYKTRCGLHVHVGTTRLKPATDLDLYHLHVKERARNRFSMPLDSWFMDNPMQFELVKDVIRRYSLHQDEINAFLPSSRTSETRGMLKAIRRLTTTASATFEACETINGLNNLIGGKYNAINLATWNRGTIEFRQHPATLSSKKICNWIDFILNLFHTSDSSRVNYGGSSATTETIVQTIETPEQPYRRGSNIGLLWSACRIEGGATVRQLMQITGMERQNIVSRFSEMRNAHGQDAIRTYTQQHYNHRYGSSNGSHDLGGYEIMREYTRTIEQETSSGALLPEADRADTSIWGGLPYEIVRYFQSGVVTRTRI